MLISLYIVDTSMIIESSSLYEGEIKKVNRFPAPINDPYQATIASWTTPATAAKLCLYVVMEGI